MNQRELLEKRNKARQLIRLSNRNKNCLKWGINEAQAHLNMKFEICKWLKEKKIEFYTEPIFNDGQRADILNTDESIVYEIYNTEDPTKSKKKYPKEFEVRYINANQEFNEKLIL